MKYSINQTFFAFAFMIKGGLKDKMELIEIKSDVLGVIDRIKRLNNGYRVYYNTKNQKLVLYLIKNNLRPSEYCLTYHFDTIDERMVEYTLKSEVQNRKAVLDEIERSNALLLKKEQKNLLEKMESEYASKRYS